MSQVVRLARFETGFVQEKWSESRIWEKLWDWTTVVRDARWSAYWGGPEPRLYCIWINYTIYYNLDAISEIAK